MSAGDAAGAGPQQQPGGAPEAAEETAETEPAKETGEAEETDRPQDVWSARRDLANHTPRTMSLDGSRVGGGVFGGVNHGIGGGTFHGDVHVGTTEIHYRFGAHSAVHSSGEIPPEALDRLAASFASAGTGFEALAERLRDEHVLVLTGPHFAGRRTAALMLLRRIGAAPVRAMGPDTSPGDLAGQLDGGGQEEARGHVLCDLITERGSPLREAHLLAVRDRLAKRDAYLVITVGPAASLEDVPVAVWRQPSAKDVLTAHLEPLADAGRVRELLSLPAVTEFLGRSHQPREAAEFARVLAGYAAGQSDERALGSYSLMALENQVQEWFEQDETSLHLREKAFLVALAVFDEAPYALTAELSDLFYSFLQRTENAELSPAVPVFGTHIGKRLQLARARRYDAEEHTEWGPVSQVMAAYLDDRAALVLLREVWTGHPSARPALVGWLRELAGDGRPLVRTRAASTVAVLAHTDLPSAMALVIEEWAGSRLFRHRLVAVSALALTHRLGTPNVPRILDAWCGSEEAGQRWVAIRTHGLIGPERPVETLAALRAAARHPDRQEDPDKLVTGELAASVALLLLSPAGDRVIAELLRTLHTDRPVFDLAVGGFVSACLRDQDDRPGWPAVLDWYARSAALGTQDAQDIAALWRAALADRGHSQSALDAMRRWVLSADDDEEVEWALAALLPALVTTTAERQRLGHLLRTMHGEDSTPPPPAAGRLLTTLPNR
ncbi:hypothetical protein AB0L80_03530 [Streptomyces sp. NPDC052069]|uniref:hypothetical protein n=1 Tax=Streptomyces sp. NPDC052069 TaxID=3154650 RepID=UPI003430B55B